MEADTTPPDFSKLSQFHREGMAFGEQLEQESDRGAALVGLAFLDELLKRLFEAKMLDGSIAKKLLRYPGALSTAAARADVAHALGWIGAKTYRDLMTLKKIRNGFAHAHEPVKFTDAAVEALCAKLELEDREYRPDCNAQGTIYVGLWPYRPATGILPTHCPNAAGRT